MITPIRAIIILGTSGGCELFQQNALYILLIQMEQDPCVQKLCCGTSLSICPNFQVRHIFILSTDWLPLKESQWLHVLLGSLKASLFVYFSHC